MNRIRAILATAAVGLVAGLALAAPAQAAEGLVPIAAECATGWYVNPDETERKPEPTEDGFKFEASDLMHHAANLPLADLEPGSYAASPAPDQPSFFSVEVRNVSGAYGTLRWDSTAGKWSITIGAGNGATAGQFEDADPVTLLTDKVTKWGAFDPETDTVVSFGVGYTLNPPGTVATVVREVSFGGVGYGLTCPEPEESPSATPPATKPPTKAPARPTATPSELPLTGPGDGINPLTILLPMGAVLVLGGVGFVLVRRNRNRFVA